MQTSKFRAAIGKPLQRQKQQTHRLFKQHTTFLTLSPKLRGNSQHLVGSHLLPHWCWLLEHQEQHGEKEAGDLGRTSGTAGGMGREDARSREEKV